MNLADRLRGVLRTGPPAATTAARPAGIVADPCDGAAAVPLEQALGGEWQNAGHARSFVVEKRVPASDAYGHFRVGECAERLRRAAPSASTLVPGLRSELPFIFFDLETTGLSGGAGTYAFLVGCGWFDDEGAFVTRQHFLAAHTGEREMLGAVTADLARSGVLVSFNGKSFDAPVLETRYLFHRLDWWGTRASHLDLLHPARRFWGGQTRETGCSLGALERRLAGMHRHDDVPGCEIPARYFEFVRSGDAGPLDAVLEHNRKDLLSLAVLTSQMLWLVSEGSEATGDAGESLALGHVYDNAGEAARALMAFRRAVEIGASAGSESPVALRSLAIAERRARRFGEAAACWQRLLDMPTCPASIVTEALEALAIHHEHRRRDLEAARAFALRSLNRGGRSTSSRSPAGNDAVRHRLARLEKKLERLNEPRLFPSSSLRPSCGTQRSGLRTSS